MSECFYATNLLASTEKNFSDLALSPHVSVNFFLIKRLSCHYGNCRSPMMCPSAALTEAISFPQPTSVTSCCVCASVYQCLQTLPNVAHVEVADRSRRALGAAMRI